MNPLLLLLIIPLVTLLAIVVAPSSKQVKWVAFGGALFQLIFVAALACVVFKYKTGVSATEGFLLTQDWPWFEPLVNIRFSVGIDGISAVMLLLTAIVMLTGILISFPHNHSEKTFYALFTLLGLGSYGFFVSTDLFMMFFFLELALVPKFLLIGTFGTGEKEYNAMKLALMLMVGSVLVFIGIVALFYHVKHTTGFATWNIELLSQLTLPLAQQRPLYLLLFGGFSIFAALFPFHSWAPGAHSSAPTAASMFLAGISMKLGGYGALRVSNFLLPDAARDLSWIFVILASIAIVYGALVSLRQRDLKYMNAFSSVSHCGLVILGLALLNVTALKGAVVQMVSHGLMTALFFAIIGMIYERTHTRDMSKLQGVLTQAPFIGTMMMMVGLCALGLPGLAGFVSELTIFQGGWQAVGLGNRIAVVFAISSIVITAVYILRALGKVAWGAPDGSSVEGMSDAKWYERSAALLLAIAILLIGLAPAFIFNLIDIDCLTIAQRLIP